MNHCEEYQTLISEYTDDELHESAAADLFFHLGSCAECRTTLKLMLALRTSIRQTVYPIAKNNRWDAFWQREFTFSYPVAALFATIVFVSTLLFIQKISQPPAVVERTKTEYVYMTPFPPVYATIHAATEFKSN